MTESEWAEYRQATVDLSKRTSTVAKQARLESRHNRLTRYEIIAENDAGHRLLVGYSTQPSRSGILRVVRAIGQRVIARLAIGENHICRWTGKGRFGHRWELGNGWIIRFTGRTERDAIIDGELQRI